MRIKDETLMAYVDGELDEIERARIDKAARTDAALARRIQAQRRLREKLAGAFGGALEEAPPDRLVEAIQSQQRPPADVVDLGQARARRAAAARKPRALPAWAGWASAAAAVVLVAGVAIRFAPQAGLAGGGPLVGGPAGSLTAQGPLAGALEQQLASAAPASGQAVRIGVSFRSTDGRYCRTFQVQEGDGFAGLACREPSGWHIRMAVANPASAQGPAFRQAATDIPAPVTSAVDNLIQGAPLDAGEEAAARARGWRH
ncbi:anti-sigma factor family protein [Phenylobacterium montanum]|uniref:Anti-sigma factor n=1 Tax=Phenylobacterium montanum TaxID=2823693 RepID=A0A975FZM3_9CAUL|nr:anti-sigma factor [Caulobacter sp. S6]QUD87266.1 anti-sigma factor [Caulobacter sp. S6]